MSFISNANHVTRGARVTNDIAGNLNVIHNTFYGPGRKRDRNEIQAPDSLDITGAPVLKRRCREEDTEDGIKTIRSKHLKLTHEIDSGPGYFFASGQVKDRAVIVKVFNEDPTVKQRLQSTVALSKGLLHPNVLRLEGVSSPASLTHFIVHENAHWKTADGPLAAALKNDLTKSITLGFKMIAGLSAGMHYLSIQGISMAALGTENFDIFLDLNDRFLISINPPLPAESDATDDRQGEDTPTRAWNVFNALCQKVLRSANHALHNEGIEREPVFLDLARPRSVPGKSFLSPSLASPESFDADLFEPEPSMPPRREYVWRTLDRGQQSLATVARRISLDLDLKLSTSVDKVVLTNGRSPHRCAGYLREEITLATTTNESAVVSHDAPSPLEICSICGEVVGFHEAFRCICDDTYPGSRPTVKCQICKFWSRSDCVGTSTLFTCATCIPHSSDSLVNLRYTSPNTHIQTPSIVTSTSTMGSSFAPSDDEDDLVSTPATVGSSSIDGVFLSRARRARVEAVASTDFMQSVANRLDEFDDVGLFRGDAGTGTSTSSTTMGSM